MPHVLFLNRKEFEELSKSKLHFYFELSAIRFVIIDIESVYYLIAVGDKNLKSNNTDIIETQLSNSIFLGCAKVLSQLPHHGGMRVDIACRGDLEVDEHHTIEDVGIALGEALALALGDKRGIERYGFTLPMDESRATVLIDLGGRIDFAWDVRFTREYVGDTPTEMFSHFFKSLAAGLRANIHVSAAGENNHHIAEGVFKAFARALRQAVRRTPFVTTLPSSKGTL